MNPPPTFICFSYLTVPKNEAQAFTASRFYSALAEAGGKVILVTLDHPEEIAPDVAQEMLSPKIELLRIPFSPPKCSVVAKISQPKTSGLQLVERHPSRRHPQSRRAIAQKSRIHSHLPLFPS